MKSIKLCFCLFFLCSLCPLTAQIIGSTEDNRTVYLFPDFERGIIAFKNNTRSAALFNYELTKQKMVFIDADSMVMAIKNPSEVLAVVVGENRFLPASSKGVFYQEMKAGSGLFYIHRKANIINTLEVEIVTTLYFKTDKGFKKFSSAKNLGGLFKGQGKKIEAFAKEKSINFSNIEDVTMIVEYAFSLMN